MNRGREICRLNQRILNGDLLVAALELLLKFRWADGDSIGDELAELLEEHAFPKSRLKFRDGHAGAGLNLVGILVPQPSSTGKCRWNDLLDSLALLLGGHLDREALRFVLERVLKDHLVEDLTRVEATHHFRDALAATHLIELALDVEGADFLAAHYGNGIGIAAGRGPAEQARNQGDHHADADQYENHCHGNLDPAIPVQIALLNAF